MRMRSKLPGVARLATAGSLALASVGALTGALVLGSAQAAGAATLSGTIPYTCQVGASTPTGKGLLTETLNIGVTATVPASVSPGGTVTLTNVQTSTTVPATLVTTLIDFLHVSSFAGNVVTFDFNATNATPATVNGVPSAGVKFSVKVKTNTPATIVVPPSPETVGPFTAGQSGTVTIVPGTVTISTVISGKTSYVGCSTTSSSIPSTEVASIAIGSSAPGTTGPATHTGEPWAGWPYWAIVGLAGVVGLGAMERAVRVRRRRA